MFYSNYVVSHVVSEIFNVEKYRDLEIRVWGQSKSLKVVKWYHSIDCIWFLLAFYSNFVPKMHHFSNIQLQKCCDLENRVKSP